MRRTFGQAYIHEDLEDRFGVTTPLNDPVEEISARVYDQIAILLTMDDVTTVENLQGAVDLSGERLRKVLADLESKGNVERDGDTVRKLDERP